jgi:hypothetical protein
MFQPIELTDNYISVLERSVPIPFKHPKINISLNEDYQKLFEKGKQILLDLPEQEEEEEEKENNKIYKLLKEKYDTVVEYTKEEVKKSDESWEKHCGMIIQLIHKEGTPMELLLTLVVHHLIEQLIFKEKIDLYNYIYSLIQLDELQQIIKDYIDNQLILFSKKNGLILTDGKEILYFILNKKEWILADEVDKIEMNKKLEKTTIQDSMLAEYIGYLYYDKTNQYIIFKVKNTFKKRNKGARCDEANKKNTIKLLNSILEEEKYTKENTKIFNNMDLCIYQELTLRVYQHTNKNNKIWFLEPEKIKLYNL